MPFCPSCRAEYRPGFTSCKNCGGVALVDKLPESIELKAEDLKDSKPVGFTQGESVSAVKVGDRELDPARVFLLDKATDVSDTLAEHGIGSRIVPLEDVFFPDGISRFEVRVHKNAHERAEKILIDIWKEAVQLE